MKKVTCISIEGYAQSKNEEIIRQHRKKINEEKANKSFKILEQFTSGGKHMYTVEAEWVKDESDMSDLAIMIDDYYCPYGGYVNKINDTKYNVVVYFD